MEFEAIGLRAAKAPGRGHAAAASAHAARQRPDAARCETAPPARRLWLLCVSGFELLLQLLHLLLRLLLSHCRLGLLLLRPPHLVAQLAPCSERVISRSLMAFWRALRLSHELGAPGQWSGSYPRLRWLLGPFSWVCRCPGLLGRGCQVRPPGQRRG